MASFVVLSCLSSTLVFVKYLKNWSFSKLFGNALYDHCPLSQMSAVYIDVSSNNTSNIYSLSPKPTKYIENPRKVSLAFYDIRALTANGGKQLNVAGTYPNPFSYVLLPQPYLHTSRFIKGSGRESGWIHCIFHNTHPNTPIQIVYLEQVPNFARVFSHTLKITSSGKELLPDYLYVAERALSEQPFHMEVVLTLPAASSTELSFHFERAFLKWTAYPPDANHGFYIPPAVISAVIPFVSNYTSPPPQITGIHPEQHIAAKGYFLRIHTEILLLVLPTPDFSMPYNVICLVCTTVALAYGPLHNITTKRLMLVDPSEPGMVKKFIQKLKLKLKKQ